MCIKLKTWRITHSCHWDCWSLEWLSTPVTSDGIGHERCRSRVSPLTNGQSMGKQTKSWLYTHTSTQPNLLLSHTFIALSINLESHAGKGGSWDIWSGFDTSDSSILIVTLCTDAVPVFLPNTCWLETLKEGVWHKLTVYSLCFHKHVNVHTHTCKCHSESYFHTESVRYFAGTYRSSCTRSPHRSLISIKVWEWSTSNCSDRQNESGNNGVKEESPGDKTQYRANTSVSIQNTHTSFYTVGKRGICAQHRLLFDRLHCRVLVEERQFRDVLISIVISTNALTALSLLRHCMLAQMLLPPPCYHGLKGETYSEKTCTSQMHQPNFYSREVSNYTDIVKKMIY